MADIYSKNVFLNHKRKINSSQILDIKEKISLFCKKNTFEQFEKIVLQLFIKLKEEDNKAEECLNYFKKYNNTLISKKPILMGASHPSDIEFIDLFDYFNDLFNWNKNRGADAKMYVATKVSEKTITDKIISNHAREMVIVTNQYNPFVEEEEKEEPEPKKEQPEAKAPMPPPNLAEKKPATDEKPAAKSS